MNSVTVICPTINSRFHLIPQVIEMYAAQDYPLKELIFICSEGDLDLAIANMGTIRPDVAHIFTAIDDVGGKRNSGCNASKSDIILHMDDDDIYAPDWISKSVQALIESEADLIGLARVNFLNHVPEAGVNDVYQYTAYGHFVAVATMCYWKNTWEKHHFQAANEGEDKMFCLSHKDKIKCHNYTDGFLAVLHGENTASHKQLGYMNKVSQEEQERILDAKSSIGGLLVRYGYVPEATSSD